MSPAFINPILVVEDSDVDFDLFLAAIAKHDLKFQIDRVETGEDALRYLQMCKASTLTIPSLVIVDLNLTGIGGLEVIVEARSDSALAAVPFVVLSTSKSPKDIREARDAGADKYLCKPIDFDQFQQNIDDFLFEWLSLRSASEPTTSEAALRVGKLSLKTE